MFRHFQIIQEEIKLEDRSRIVDNVRTIQNIIREYGDLVKQHREKFPETFFLSYPSCPGGHYFHIKGSSLVGGNSFNSTEDYKGLQQAVSDMEYNIESFCISSSAVPQVELLRPEDFLEGFYGISYKHRIELTRELLKRVNE